MVTTMRLSTRGAAVLRSLMLVIACLGLLLNAFASVPRWICKHPATETCGMCAPEPKPDTKSTCCKPKPVEKKACKCELTKAEANLATIAKIWAPSFEVLGTLPNEPVNLTDAPVPLRVDTALPRNHGPPKVPPADSNANRAPPF